jgi:peroxiredoxin Q/BCP
VRFTAINAAAIVAAIGMALGMHSAARAADTPAMLAVGTKAPAVVGKSVYAGKIEDFDMSKALASGAIVLYFFPKAFTEG